MTSSLFSSGYAPTPPRGSDTLLELVSDDLIRICLANIDRHHTSLKINIYYARGAASRGRRIAPRLAPLPLVPLPLLTACPTPSSGNNRPWQRKSLHKCVVNLMQTMQCEVNFMCIQFELDLLQIMPQLLHSSSSGSAPTRPRWSDTLHC